MKKAALSGREQGQEVGGNRQEVGGNRQEVGGDRDKMHLRCAVPSC